jgi:hypothetical protein
MLRRASETFIVPKQENPLKINRNINIFKLVLLFFKRIAIKFCLDSVAVMPVTWRLEESVLIVTLVGEDREGLAKAILEAMADDQFQRGTSLLLDVRHASDSPRSSEVRRAAMWMAALKAKGLGSRCAVIVGPQPYQYGLARMAEAHLDFHKIELEIFTELDKAFQWLWNGSATPSIGE